jgi:hypothetical protein
LPLPAWNYWLWVAAVVVVVWVAEAVLAVIYRTATLALSPVRQLPLLLVQTELEGLPNPTALAVLVLYLVVSPLLVAGAVVAEPGEVWQVLLAEARHLLVLTVFPAVRE